MPRIQYINVDNGTFQEAHGSGNRLNVSSRSDSRAYYNSRDLGRSFSLVFDHQSAAAGEFSAYWKNTSTNDRELVITHIGLNALQSARVKLHFVTGTAAGGTSASPLNTNKSKTAEAEATARLAAAGDAITGLSSVGVVDFVAVPGNGTVSGHEEFRIGDVFRLGQGDALAIEYDEGTTGDFWGVIYGFYE
jgi:hypothetical protein